MKRDIDNKSKQIRKVLFYTFFLNFSVSCSKIIVGFLCGITNIIADGFHSLSDSLINIVGYVSVKLSEKRADEKHPYGYEKYETIATIIIGSICFLLGLQIIQLGISKIINPQPIVLSKIIFAVMIFSAIINIITVIYEGGKSRELNSEFLKADSNETLADIYVSVGIIVGLFFIQYKIYILDGIITVLISLLIIKNSISIFKEASLILADTNIIDHKEIENIVLKNPNIMYCHAIRSRGKKDAIYIDLHIGVVCNTTIEKAHDKISHNVKQLLQSKIAGVKSVNIHIEPDNIRARNRVRSIFKKTDY